MTVTTGRHVGVLKYKDKEKDYEATVEIGSRFDDEKSQLFLSYLFSRSFKNLDLLKCWLDANKSNMWDMLLVFVFVKQLKEAFKQGVYFETLDATLFYFKWKDIYFRAYQVNQITNLQYTDSKRFRKLTNNKMRVRFLYAFGLDWGNGNIISFDDIYNEENMLIGIKQRSIMAYIETGFNCIEDWEKDMETPCKVKLLGFIDDINGDG